ncbi:MAG: hypothetical protein ACFFDN_42895 [Candidatus Hodarchaeota archaeon]
MKFLSYDCIEEKECETEIKNADLDTSRQFVQTWTPDYLTRLLKDPNFSYGFFEWDKIIKSSYILGFNWRCFGAFTNNRLDGLLCLSINSILKIEFIATAPWNYYINGRMRRIGSGLIFFTIQTSINHGRGGEFLLYSLPDAEKFYEDIGMEATGNMSDFGPKEYKMPKAKAESFFDNFKKYIIN